MTNGYLRFPHLHDDLVTFVAADDVWLAPLSGGRAWRLTDDAVPVRSPRFSPDGSRIAWTSTRDGHAEVMVLDLAGGPAERLTYWGNASTNVLGWTADGRVLVSSTAGEANLRHAMVKAVGLDGSVERLPWGPVSGVAQHPDGTVVVATPGSRPPAWWKRYRGGTASRLWWKSPDGEWKQLLADDTAGLVSPVWIGDELIFASDREATFPDGADGQANLWALNPRSGAAPRRITDHTSAEGYVRDPTGDGRRVVYHARGTLYLLADLAGPAQPLTLILPSTVQGRRPRLLDPSENLDAIHPDHGADASLVEWRGKALLLTHREGPVRVIAAESGVRVRSTALLGSTGDAVMVSDADGDDRLEVRPLRGGTTRVLAGGKLGRVLHLAPGPAGDVVAVITHDGRILVVDLASGDIRQVGHSPHGEAESPVFSPDGSWLVWSQPVTTQGNQQLMAAHLGTAAAEPVVLTSGRFNDTSPDFTRDGRYLAFLSARTFDPRYDTHSFAMSFASATRPYLVPLSPTEPAPFGPSADGWRLSKPAAPDSTAATDAGTTDPGTAFEPAHIEERLIPFPVPSGNYRSLRCAKDAVLWIHENADRGEIGSARAGVTGDEPADVVESWSFERRELVTLVDKADRFDVSGDGERIVVVDDGAVTVRSATQAMKDDDKDLVTVDLDRLRFELDPVAEWRQMFDECARIMRDHYWRADMNGVDWDGVVQRYRPLTDKLGSHDDLVDLLWETVGELNTSHAYVLPTHAPGDAARRLGLLGADLSAAPEGWRIDRILPGESSDPAARSPLRAAGVGARVGDTVVAVGGVPVDRRFGPAAALVGAVDQPVELTLRDPDGTERQVVVVPIGDEEPLRYQAWVASRQAYVREHGAGRIGYVHLPDMMSFGWAQLHRDLEEATQAEGLIVDVRYNRGGHISQLVLERLSRTVVGWSVARHLVDASTYPQRAPRGPVVLVTNEFAGSDGDIVNAGAQAMRLGPVIGSRTWGGVVGVDGRFDLVDGTGVTQPRYAYWIRGKEWSVENHGVDPDIEVTLDPGQWHAAADPHLDTAIAEVLRGLENTPAAVPPELPEPRVRQG